jgi:hypothetical protein
MVEAAIGGMTLTTTIEAGDSAFPTPDMHKSAK